MSDLIKERIIFALESIAEIIAAPIPQLPAIGPDPNVPLRPICKTSKMMWLN